VKETEPAASCPVARGVKAWLKRNRELSVVLLIAVLAFFGRAWEGDLHGDPVHYAAIAKNILSTGDWLTMHDSPSLIYANKPPLMFWLTAANFRLFGVTTFAARFWSCLFAVGICAMVFLIGRRLFGATAGLLGGCIVAVTPGMIMNSIDLRLDSAVSLAVAATAYAVVRAVQDERPSWLLLAGLAGGLGLMTKMAAAVHVPAVLVLWLLVSRPRWFLSPYLWGALALGAAIAAPWHLAVLNRHGREFTSIYVDKEMGQRIVFGSHMAKNLAQNIGVFLVFTAPWCLLAAVALFRWRRADARERWGMLLAVLWIAEVMAFIVVVPKRYDRYLTTAYPAVALLAGCGLAGLIPERRRDRLPRLLRTVAIIGAFLLALTPMPLHKCRNIGYEHARALLDRLEPKATLAGYFPGPANEEHSPGGAPWSIRAKTTYCLDRNMIVYKQLDDVLKSGGRFVVTRERHVPDLVRAGFEAVLDLDESYCLLQRGGPAAAVPTGGGGPR